MDDFTSHRDSSLSNMSSEKNLRFSPLPQKDENDSTVKSIEHEEEDYGNVLVMEPQSDARSSSKHRRVSFRTIEIQEYAIIPGENPAVTMGIPLTIDWTPLARISCDLEQYEAQRSQPPRSMVELRIPMLQRYHMLKNLHFSHREIHQHVRAATIGRNQRKRTHATLHLEPIQERLERFRRAVANATWNRSKKQQERQLLQPYVKQRAPESVYLNSCLKKQTSTTESDGTTQKMQLQSNTTARLFRSHPTYIGSFASTPSSNTLEEDGEDDLRHRRHKEKVPNSIKKKLREQEQIAKQNVQRLKQNKSILSSIEAMGSYQQQRMPSHRNFKSKTRDSVELWSQDGRSSLDRRERLATKPKSRKTMSSAS
ncbi:hypothetical protein IV203_011641 [Nitzschia inconspicua]|uniref:Uncharacterized protein n=1 Tax=Nitzschia inconspicua TaxID=303405 RepID=A0A9K3KTI7_9STRA|nr:hypothetical protein IV203_011641 [Nitzschia inconspicua]